MVLNVSKERQETIETFSQEMEIDHCCHYRYYYYFECMSHVSIMVLRGLA